MDASGDVVLIRNEARKKFHATYFGPFKILEANWLGTYAKKNLLIISSDNDLDRLRGLVNGWRRQTIEGLACCATINLSIYI